MHVPYTSKTPYIPTSASLTVTSHQITLMCFLSFSPPGIRIEAAETRAGAGGEVEAGEGTGTEAGEEVEAGGGTGTGTGTEAGGGRIAGTSARRTETIMGVEGREVGIHQDLTAITSNSTHLTRDHIMTATKLDRDF